MRLHGGPTRAERARGIGGGRALGVAPGFYPRCPPLGAAPRIRAPLLNIARAVGSRGSACSVGT